MDQSRLCVVALLFILVAPWVCPAQEPAGDPAAGNTPADEPTAAYNEAMKRIQWYDWDGAIPYLNHAIELRPNYADAWLQRGIAKAGKKKYEEAITDFDQAARLNPKTAAVFTARANAYSHLGNLAGAIADYGDVIKLDPENGDAFFKRGEAELTLGENAEAISDLTEAIRLQPQNERAYRSRAFAYAADDQNEKAVDDFAKVVELNALESQDWHNLGVTNLRLGRNDKAINAFDEALRINPQRDNSYYSRANAQLESGDMNGALSDFSKVIELNPKKADAWGRRGLILLEKGRDAAARKDFIRCFQLAPQLQAQYTPAIDQIMKTRRIDPNIAADEDPISPEDAVEQYAAAARAGDVERVGRLYYEPISTPYRELYQVLIQVGESKKKLAAALDARFGRAPLSIPLPDDTQIREQLKRLVSMTVQQKAPDSEGYVMKIEIIEMKKEGSGTTSSVQVFLAREQGGSWKVGPNRDEHAVQVATESAAALQQVPTVIDKVTADVNAGRYVNRHDAEQAVILGAAAKMPQSIR
jgi:tetratricopeptide (TPR) repeat protein